MGRQGLSGDRGPCCPTGVCPEGPAGAGERVPRGTAALRLTRSHPPWTSRLPSPGEEHRSLPTGHSARESSCGRVDPGLAADAHAPAFASGTVKPSHIREAVRPLILGADPCGLPGPQKAQVRPRSSLHQSMSTDAAGHSVSPGYRAEGSAAGVGDQASAPQASAQAAHGRHGPLATRSPVCPVGSHTFTGPSTPVHLLWGARYPTRRRALGESG